MKPLSAFALVVPLVLAARVPPAFASQPTDPPPSADPAPPPPALPASDPPTDVPADPVIVDPSAARTEASPVAAERDEEPEMSEGRRIVVAWNTGFQWGLSPGIFVSGNETSFALSVRFGYGFDTGTFIVVPGVRLSGYFSTPSVYLGMPIVKLVLPIDRFAPFVEAGAGVGYLDSAEKISAHTGLAVLGGAGFMVHFSMKFGLGVEANYQVVTGSDFKGFGVGPILALAF